jgi:phage shock protein PspC (stress-responsive transcriptional regulator)
MVRLFRSSHNRVLLGVCGGVGERYGWDPTWVRLAFVLATLAGGPGIVVYLVAALIMPRNPSLTGFEAASLPPPY